jgi:tRNA pseudouridine(38-40) synthase
LAKPVSISAQRCFTALKSVRERLLPRNLKLTLAYDGHDFAGWQVQPDRVSVQGTLVFAFEQLTGEKTLPQGSGRTDAGVHALAQVATVSIQSPIPTANLVRALNDVLPRSIRVLDVQEVPPDFHARHSAIAKTYRYHIYRGAICSPFLARYVYHHPYPLDEAHMAEAAAIVEGEHDFTSFAAVDPEKRKETLAADQETLAPNPDLEPQDAEVEATSADREPKQAALHKPALHESGLHEPGLQKVGSQKPGLQKVRLQKSGLQKPGLQKPGLQKVGLQKVGLQKVGPHTSALEPNNVRTIFHSSWQRQGDEFIYTVRGNGFLHHMVRNLVGTFLMVGKGSLTIGDIRRILELRDRSAAAGTAPASGLFLVSVEY